MKFKWEQNKISIKFKLRWKNISEMGLDFILIDCQVDPLFGWNNMSILQTEYHAVIDNETLLVTETPLQY